MTSKSTVLLAETRLAEVEQPEPEEVLPEVPA
jgi:hypothetical protein